MNKTPQPHSFHESVIGQNRAMQMLANMLAHGTLHHALIFYGPRSVGKTTAAFNLIKTLNCEMRLAALKPEVPTGSGRSKDTEADLFFCNTCPACQAVNFHKTPNLRYASLEDRLPYGELLQTMLKDRTAKATAPSTNTADAMTQHLAEQLVRECYRLIARHQDGILLPLKYKKVSYPEGVLFNQKTLEKHVHELYNALELFHTRADISALITPARLENLKYIQNSLDRTYFAKVGIDKAFAWATQTAASVGSSMSKHPPVKTLIIKNIEKINYAVVGKFLKILEDPLPHTQFILIAENLTELNAAVIAPLLSRCFKIPFLSLSERAMQQVLAETLGITAAAPENLEMFFRNPKLHLTTASAKSESKLVLSIIQARKRSLSYIQYLARQHPEDVKTLLADLKAGLAYYLETYFIKVSRDPAVPYEGAAHAHKQKIALAIKQIPLSLKKSLAFRALIQKCEHLRHLGVMSPETMVNRLALFIRKIY